LPATPAALTSGSGGGLSLISQGIDMRGLGAMDGGLGGKAASAAMPGSAQGLPTANVQAVAKILADTLHAGDAHDLSSLVGGSQGASVATLAAAGPTHAGGDASLALDSGLSGIGGGDAAHILSTMMAHAAAAHAHV